MFFLHSAVKFVTIILVCCCFGVLALPIKNILEDLEDSNNNALIRTEFNIANNVMVNPEEARLRVKRDESNNKYIETTHMNQLKVLRLFLQGLKNLVVPSTNVGGAHPLHPSSVKPAVALFRDKLVEFFFPDIEGRYMPTDTDAEGRASQKKTNSNRRSNSKGDRRYTISSLPTKSESAQTDIETNDIPQVLSN